MIGNVTNIHSSKALLHRKSRHQQVSLKRRSLRPLLSPRQHLLKLNPLAMLRPRSSSSRHQIYPTLSPRHLSRTSKLSQPTNPLNISSSNSSSSSTLLLLLAPASRCHLEEEAEVTTPDEADAEERAASISPREAATDKDAEDAEVGSLAIETAVASTRARASSTPATRAEPAASGLAVTTRMATAAEREAPRGNVEELSASRMDPSRTNGDEARVCPAVLKGEEGRCRYGKGMAGQRGLA